MSQWDSKFGFATEISQTVLKGKLGIIPGHRKPSHESRPKSSYLVFVIHASVRLKPGHLACGWCRGTLESCLSLVLSIGIIPIIQLFFLPISNILNGLYHATLITNTTRALLVG